MMKEFVPLIRPILAFVHRNYYSYSSIYLAEIFMILKGNHSSSNRDCYLNIWEIHQGFYELFHLFDERGEKIPNPLPKRYD